MTTKDLLDWTNLKPDIEISYTKKKFFNVFYYRLTYLVPGARLITYGFEGNNSLASRVKNYNDRSQIHYNWGYYDTSCYIRRQANLNQLKDFAEIYQNKLFLIDSKIKFRIESEILNIYSDNEKTLYTIASENLATWYDAIQSIVLVKNPEDFSLLDQGYIIMSRPQTHPYRIKLKETFSFYSERQSLISYVQNLGDQVRASKYILSRLESKNKYFPGGYIHVSDERLINMLRLIAPNIIGTVNPLIAQ